MKFWNYLYGTVIIMAIGMLYEKYKFHFVPDEELNNQELINKHLLNNDTNLGKNKKPILWIFTERNKNSRNWPSFYSRNTEELNQPYLITCVETIIKHCGDSFNISLIDDSTFKKLIPGWNIDIDAMGDPLKSYMRQLGLTKILYYYGGFLLPNSTIVMKDLKPVFDDALKTNSFFSVEGMNKGDSALYAELFPMTKIMGCKRHCPIMKNFMQFLEKTLSSDYTDESNFLGQANRWIYQNCKENKITLINSEIFGITNKEGKLVTIEDLMGSTFIEFGNNTRAIYVDSNEILKRVKYQWFARLSQKQLINCNTMLAKYLLIAREKK